MSEIDWSGPVAWVDLTVEDAGGLRDFYAGVMGWTPSGVDMGGYEDYAMADADGNAAAGVCHSRGPNTGLPPVWMPYFRVADIEQATARVVELGGSLIRPLGAPDPYGRTAFVRDPAGTAFGLFQPGSESAPPT